MDTEQTPTEPTEVPATEVPPTPSSDADKGIDLSEVRNVLGVSPEATHEEFETELVKVIAFQEARYKQLADSIQAQDEAIVNRILDDNAPLIGDDRDFWKAQLIANRAATLTALESFKSIVQEPVAEVQPPPAPVAPQPTPLANRATALPPNILTLPIANRNVDAAAIRNRAHEILKASPKAGWIAAFKQAEKELTPKENPK